MKRKKVIVLGLDGATWNLLKDWSEMGELTNFGQLMRRGVIANLISSIPPITFPAWKCYSTGKNPGKLGVYSFINFDKMHGKISINNSLSFKSREIWDYIGEKGLKVGVINMPTTFPPKEVNGFMIANSFSPNKGFVYPPQLEDFLKENGYRSVSESEIISFIKNRNFSKLEKFIDSEFKILENAITQDEYDFVHLTVFCTDTAQHILWDTEELKNIWKYIDNQLGKLLKIFQDDCILIIMSDHGFSKLFGEFYVNMWLNKEGYLKFKQIIGIRKLILNLGIDTFILSKILEKLKLNYLLNRLSRSFIKKISRNIPTEFGDRIENRMDWKNSKAVFIEGGGIYINPKFKQDKITTELYEKLKNLRDPHSNEKLIKDILNKHDIYFGDYIRSAPDLTLLEGKFRFKDLVRSDEKIIDFGGIWLAGHQMEGIFLAYGNSIKKGYKHSDIEIVDLAPTILHILDVPVTEDIDGKVIKEIFKEDSRLYKKKIIYRKSGKERDYRAKYQTKIDKNHIDNEKLTKNEESEIKDRLRELGYL